jgi:hypothetical protein
MNECDSGATSAAGAAAAARAADAGAAFAEAPRTTSKPRREPDDALWSEMQTRVAAKIVASEARAPAIRCAKRTLVSTMTLRYARRSFVTIMADIINLGRYRKAKERAQRARVAEEQRVRHGRTKIEKQAVQAEQQRQADVLAGKWLVREDKEPEQG